MMDCKKALVDNNGDVEAATEFLRKKGLASAEKKSSRAAKEGIIETYIHTGAKLGIMVEVNCETDFVAKRPEFQELAKALAMQIAASPTVEVVSESDIAPDFIEKEKKIESQSEDLQGKPDEIVAKIVEGRVNKLIKTKVRPHGARAAGEGGARSCICRFLRCMNSAGSARGGRCVARDGYPNAISTSGVGRCSVAA
jgi:elongation factor Ts